MKGLGLHPIAMRSGGGYTCAETNPITMNSLKKPTLVALAFAVFAALVASGCNTMKGLGKDTERVVEKIQDKASR